MCQVGGQSFLQRFCEPLGRGKKSFPTINKWPPLTNLFSNLPKKDLPHFNSFSISASIMTGSSLTTLNNEEKSKETTVKGKVFPPVDQIKAVLFDVDGTLADSDPLHYLAFREILQEVGFQNGVPIDEEFFNKYISGRHNPDIGKDFFPDWPEEKRDALLVEKEARFRKVAAEKLEEVQGLHRLCKWLELKGIRRAAVTNAPRENAEQMIASLGLSSFFEELVIGSECERAKPFPDPYLKALELLNVSAEHAFAVEDSPSGMKAAVAAGLPTIGILTCQKASVLENVGASFTINDFNDPRLWQKLEGTA